MPDCPEGLTLDYGLPKALEPAVCVMKSDFGIIDGERKIRTGSGLLFRTFGRSSYVVTAGHNIYDHDSDRTAGAIMLWFGREGGTYLAQREGRAFNVPSAFVEATTPIASDDFGIIRVTALGRDRFTPVSLGDAEAAGDTLMLVGYPDEGRCTGSFKPYHIRIGTHAEGRSNYGYGDEPTYVGMSGGPLVGRLANDRDILTFGLHIRGAPNEARGVRFGERVRGQIVEWSQSGRKAAKA